MFDTKSEIAFEARAASIGTGTQLVAVRWPTDEEWAARARAKKIIIRRLGRGVTETVPAEPSEADVKLYQAIALNGAPSMTAAEAARVLDTIGTAEVVDVSVEGDEALVQMEVLSGAVKHFLHIPSADQVLSFRRSAFRLLDLPYNQQEIRINPDAGARLYDTCGGRSTDYTGAIPAPHKDAAVRAVIDFIDRHLGPKPHDESF